MKTPSRSIERLRHHYEVERELAQRLLHSTRAERPQLFRTLYDELFQRVPDHPRLVRRETAESSRRSVANQMMLLRGQLGKVGTFLEFAPGDCRLAFEVCRHVREVIGVDISDQSGGKDQPANFKLVVYDGYQLNVPDESVDLVFSYQFLEHLHPDDVELHFQTVFRILKPGGAYVFSTPHRFSGPHDISRFFSDTPEGFHLKEWTYGELGQLVARLGFSRWHSYRLGAVRRSAIANGLTLLAEGILGGLPRKLRKRASGRVFQDVAMMVCKDSLRA